MDTDRSGEGLDAELLDAIGELIQRVTGHAENVAKNLGLPLFSCKALHLLKTTMPMKELGQLMRCDPSFVTGIADVLEKRGLAVRQTCPADRRIKNLALTSEGMTIRERLEREFLAIMPIRALDLDERRALLRLVRKMISAENGPWTRPAASEAKEEVATR